MNIAQITPAFPPEISGVGDYSEILHQALSKRSNFKTLVTHHVSGLSDHRVTCLTNQRSSRELASALGSADHVLLHFSGYGYAPQGLCHWLVDGLRTWKQARMGRRLVTLFHEVFATGPIWRSSFWTARPQRCIARELARLSDATFVTTEGGLRQLTSICPSLSAEVLPVFSTIGELRDPRPLVQRPPNAIVFGSAGRRQHVYHAAIQQAEVLACGLSHLGIKEIIDIGPGSVSPFQLAGVPIRQLGILSSSDISLILSECRLGLIYSSGQMLSKSTMAAACFSHGLLVVNTGRVDDLPAVLALSRNYITPRLLSKGWNGIQDIAAAGLAWYAQHGVEATVQRIFAALMPD